jgi:hypothetical protein
MIKNAGNFMIVIISTSNENEDTGLIDVVGARKDGGRLGTSLGLETRH